MLLRLGQLVCGAIVLGIVGYFFSLVSDAGVIDPNARLVYAAVIAALTILGAIIFMAPFAYSFWSFPVDFIFFAAWLVVFCALETVSCPSLMIPEKSRLTAAPGSLRESTLASRTGTEPTGAFTGAAGTGRLPLASM